MNVKYYKYRLNLESHTDRERGIYLYNVCDSWNLSIGNSYTKTLFLQITEKLDE